MYVCLTAIFSRLAGPFYDAVFRKLFVTFRGRFKVEIDRKSVFIKRSSIKKYLYFKKMTVVDYMKRTFHQFGML